MTHSRLTLLAGIGATGKSSYGRWLEAERGFWHIDVENYTPNERAFVEAWWRLCNGRAAPEDITAAAERPIVIDWGFPPSAFQMVDRIKGFDIPIWWFDGDRDAARASFIKRRTEDVASFDRYLAELQQYWAKVEPIIRDSTINVIYADGSYMPPQDIYKIMFEGGHAGTG